MSIRIAIFGVTSWYSGTFAASIRALGKDRAELVGAAHLGVPEEIVSSLIGGTREQFGDRHQVRLFVSAEALLAETQPDLVLVTAPDREKPEYAALGLAAGADVFISKPMAATPEGAAKIRDAARSHPNRLAGALNPARFATAIRESHRRVSAGEIGEVLTTRAWIQHGAPDPARSRAGNPEAGDGQGGPEYSLGVYAADLLNWFLDAAHHPPVRAYAEYDTLNSPGWPWMDSGKAVARYEGGRIGSMDILFATPCPAPLWEIEVVGRDGILRTNGGNYEGMIWRRQGRDRPAVEPFAPTVDDTILAAIAHVVACCAERTPFEMDAEDGYRAIELCEAWRRSAATNLPVTLPLDDHRDR